MKQYLITIPPRFLQDCQECDVDTGDYDAKTRVWEPTLTQLDDVLDRAKHYATGTFDAADFGLVTSARALLKAVQAKNGVYREDYVNAHLTSRPGDRVRPEIVCKDGTRFSVQASEGHYCSPRDRVGPYSSVEVYVTERWLQLPLWGKPDQGGDPAKRLYGWLSVARVNAEIARRGGLAK